MQPFVSSVALKSIMRENVHSLAVILIQWLQDLFRHGPGNQYADHGPHCRFCNYSWPEKKTIILINELIKFKSIGMFYSDFFGSQEEIGVTEKNASITK